MGLNSYRTLELSILSTYIVFKYRNLLFKASVTDTSVWTSLACMGSCRCPLSKILLYLDTSLCILDRVLLYVSRPPVKCLQRCPARDTSVHQKGLSEGLHSRVCSVLICLRWKWSCFVWSDVTRFKICIVPRVMLRIGRIHNPAVPQLNIEECVHSTIFVEHAHRLWQPLVSVCLALC
jgi:hypothetical protein